MFPVTQLWMMWSVRSRTFSFIPESAGLNEIFLTYGPAWTREGGGPEGLLGPRCSCSQHAHSAGLLMESPRSTDPSPLTLLLNLCCRYMLQCAGDWDEHARYLLSLFSVCIQAIFSHDCKEPCKISFIHCLKLQSVVLNVIWCRLFTCIFYRKYVQT